MAKQVRASHILVKTENQAKDLLGRVNSGENFGDLAKKYSDCPSKKNGGDLGWFGRGMMVKEFEDAAFSLPVGVVSAPIKTEFGYHLIVVTQKK